MYIVRTYLYFLPRLRHHMLKYNDFLNQFVKFVDREHTNMSCLNRLLIQGKRIVSMCNVVIEYNRANRYLCNMMKEIQMDIFKINNYSNLYLLIKYQRKMETK